MNNEQSFVSSMYGKLKDMFAAAGARILFIILIASVTANIFQFYAKGITIDRSDRSDRSDRRVTHQEQMQGQLFIQNGFVKGDHISWEVKTFKTYQETLDYLTALHPTSSYFSKINTIISDNETVYVVWTPSILDTSSGK